MTEPGQLPSGDWNMPPGVRVRDLSPERECPVCGEAVTAFDGVCQDCGYEF